MALTRHAPRAARPLAFTLIELLVVIAIVGVLASLLAPVVGRSKQKAVSAQCRGNLRQLGLALRLYADQNQGRLPNVDSRGIDARPGYELRAMMAEAEPGLFRCRGDTTGRFEAVGSSYDWNPRFSGKLLHGATAEALGTDRSEAGALLFDHADWHRHKNGLFPDGHVDRLRAAN